jgi:predicted enzyme related to lactoylglutathione lyase
MGKVTLSLLVLKTQQMERLLSFYSSLGIELTEEKHGNGPAHYAGRIGDAVIEVYPLSKKDLPPDVTMRLGFTVEKLERVMHSLKAIGTTIITEPQATKWGVRAEVQDPDGRAVELYQR